MSTSNSNVHNRTSVLIDPDLISNGMPSLISNEIRAQIEIVFQIVLFTVTCVFGILSNILNIVVYWKQGLKDSITVGLFALSVSDFFVVLFPLFTTACYIVDYLYPDSIIDFKAVSSVAAIQPRFMFYSISSALTVLLSIERCLCVIRPMKVKLIFTRQRTITMTIFIFLFFILGWLPKYYAQPLKWQKSMKGNNTEVFTIWYHPYFDFLEAYHNSVMTILFPTAAQVVITIAAVIMINGLRKASKFRQMATKGGQKQIIDSNSVSISRTATIQEKEVVTDARDARLVKTMVILVTLLSVANVPYIGLEYTQLFEPEMRPGKRYENLFRVILGINVFIGSINASVNSFVYYNVGSRYRKIVNEMFCRQDKS